jgi:hypothetical protein
MLSRTWHWLMPAKLYSTGSSAVMILRAVQLVQRAVQRRRLARAGRAGHEEDAVGPLDDLLELLVVVLLEAEVLDADADAVRPQDTQHARLAVVRGQRADAEVDVVLVDAELDAAVLREALLGDVDAGHDLDAADQRGLHLDRDAVALDALAVDAVADADAVLHRLDVDVARPVAHGLGDHRLHELDDRRLRRVVGDVGADAVDVDRLVDRAVDRPVHRPVHRLVHRPVHRALHPVDGLVHRLVDRVRRRRVRHLVDDRLDPAAAGEAGADLLVEAEPQDVQHLQVQRVVDRDAQPPVLHAERQDQVLLHQVVGDQRGRVGRQRPAVDLDVLHVVLGGQGLVDVALAAQLQVDQGLADAEVLGLGVVQGLLDLLLRDDAPLDQLFPELLLCLGHGEGLLGGLWWRVPRRDGRAGVTRGIRGRASGVAGPPAPGHSAPSATPRPPCGAYV